MYRVHLFNIYFLNDTTSRFVDYSVDLLAFLSAIQIGEKYVSISASDVKFPGT